MTRPAQEQTVDIKQRFFRFNTLATFLIAAVIFYIFFTRFDSTETISIIKNSNLLLIILGIIVFYGLIPLRGYRWRDLLIESNISLPTMLLTRIYFLAFFVNSILPARIGDIYRAYLLKKKQNISFSLSIGVLFSERIFDLASTALLVLISGYFYIGLISEEYHNYILTGLIIIGGIVLAFAVLSWRSKWLLYVLPRKFHKHFESFSKGIFRSPVKIPIILSESLIIWLSEAARFYFIAWALGCRVDFLLAVFISQASLIIMSLPLTPAGLGLVELFMFAALLPAGLTNETAAAIIIADRLISYWLVIILGGLHYIFSPRYR